MNTDQRNLTANPPAQSDSKDDDMAEERKEDYQRGRLDTLKRVREKIAEYKAYYNPIGDERNTGRQLAMADILELIASLEKEES